ncbi:MAG: hypothetical protein IPG96_21595 [Proteobacteria bacterium]|nr:hypothetical protein [Pseudomonadota bacterium]
MSMSPLSTEPAAWTELLPLILIAPAWPLTWLPLIVTSALPLTRTPT